MPNASTTQASSASATTGTPVPLSYGYVWVTGKRANYYELQDTGNHDLDYTRAGMWLLGEGEWDGCSELWINDVLVWKGANITPTRGPYWLGWNWIQTLDSPTQNMMFNFHAGTDAEIGSGLNPSSYGPDQGVEVTFTLYPPAIQPLHYSRIAYYAIVRKQPANPQTNTHSDDPSQWTDINPIGLWRSTKCRLFDSNGNMTGYAFTTNPVWHWVDARLRRKLMPEYNLDLTLGADNLTSAVQACFDWNKIYTSAQYCDEFLANGRRRFQGSYSFAQATSLQAIESQILMICRGYLTSYGGKYAINIDMPRPTSFTFSRQHVLPGTFEASDQSVHTAPNQYVAQFRDLLVPQASVIASIENTSNGNPVVTTEEPHPFNTGDFIAIGGTDTTYDGEWQVYSVPDIINPGTPEEIDPTQLTLYRKGSNYPTSVGSGGSIGLLYSRFNSRSPEFWHKANMLARGAVGLNVPRLRNKVKLALDMAITTYDQASRIARYERDRALGVDTTGADGQIDAPYITPPFVKLRTSMFARDQVGNLACAIEPGDHVTIDATLSATYAGEYEVLDPKTVFPPTTQAAGSGDSLQLAPSQSSGEIEFTLGPYNEAILYDDSDALQAGWPSVPGSDPGNDTTFTAIPLAGGGDFVFFTGIADSGTQFQLPSTGYPAGNMLAWASAAGANVAFHSAHTIQLCDASASRQLSLIYDDDEGHDWGGSIGYGAVTWLGAGAAPTSVGGINWVVLTLLGGEIIAFGQGILADGTTITNADMPPGFAFDPRFALAFIHDQPANPNIMFFAGAYIDPGGTVHVNVSDDTGHVWHGNASVLIFAFQNNMGTFTTETVDGAFWAHCTLSNGMKFGAGVSKAVANGGTFGIPATAGEATTLQVIAGSSDGTYAAGSNHAQGIGACYVDASNVVHIFFQDGNDADPTWPGTADVFGLYCESNLATPTIVIVTPPSVTLPAGGTQVFAAVVTGNANPNVIWKVDGIVGGNPSVGTISSTGVYGAPNAAGSHTITAMSVGDPTASGNAVANIYGAILTGDVLTDDFGTIIYTDTGDTITD